MGFDYKWHFIVIMPCQGLVTDLHKSRSTGWVGVNIAATVAWKEETEAEQYRVELQQLGRCNLVIRTS